MTSSRQKKSWMSRRIFVNDRGQATCKQHANRFLKQCLLDDPEGKTHLTPFGTYFDMSNDPKIECDECLDIAEAELLAAR